MTCQVKSDITGKWVDCSAGAYQTVKSYNRKPRDYRIIKTNKTMDSQIKYMSNEEIIARVNAWQNAGFVHPLTCRWKSSHGNLFPIVVNGKVVLRCPKCKMPHQDQLNIPPSVLSITPEFMEEEKQKMIELGFKF